MLYTSQCSTRYISLFFSNWYFPLTQYVICFRSTTSVGGCPLGILSWTTWVELGPQGHCCCILVSDLPPSSVLLTASIKSLLLMSALFDVKVQKNQTSLLSISTTSRLYIELTLTVLLTVCVFNYCTHFHSCSKCSISAGKSHIKKLTEQIAYYNYT